MLYYVLAVLNLLNKILTYCVISRLIPNIVQISASRCELQLLAKKRQYVLLLCNREVTVVAAFRVTA